MSNWQYIRLNRKICFVQIAPRRPFTLSNSVVYTGRRIAEMRKEYPHLLLRKYRFE